MKRLAITLFLIIITNSLSGQSSAIEQPNKSVIRLTVVNENGDILLKKSPLGWVTIATFYTERQNFNQVLDSLTNTFGIEISKPELGGLFTYTYNFKNSLQVYLHLHNLFHYCLSWENPDGCLHLTEIQSIT